MDVMKSSLTVFFDEPFWVGVFERVEGRRISVCKVTFGTEPKDYEVWEFVLKHYKDLAFSPVVETRIRQAADSPKRRKRNARKQLTSTGVGTKAQQALQKQREELKTERAETSRIQREEEKQRKYEIRQQKRKEKHRGH